jgi:methylenetetrahydrofolate dehydrogenase (NADP+)/methenyltetrahydrofolate cyclohydrolase/formyltetrahydrofolate synthetase
MQGTPLFVHAGSLTDVAHGKLHPCRRHRACPEEGDAADRVGYVLTGGGLGADMCMEKFCNIKCQVSGLKPDTVVIVATTWALNMHGGGPDVTPRKPLHETYTKENLAILGEGCKILSGISRTATSLVLRSSLASIDSREMIFILRVVFMQE